ncbi:ankyrin repeat-containing protein [Trichonephila clavipes]|nr:ankyrin repeat-containing protein [Trichonephila clavipes]
MMLSGKNKGKEISVIRVDTQDEFLDVGNGVRYKFDNSIISYLQENKDFIKREVGREVSDKEIEDFLNKLVFAVNLPSGTELSEIIRSELGKEFSNTDAKHFFSRYQEEVLTLLEKEGEEFLSYTQAKAILERIREEVLKIPICYNVIDPIDNFIGKGNELNAVHCGLQKSARQIVVIRGPSGVGKTEFVKKYAHDHKECYGGNVIFINARDYKSVKESFLDLAKDKRLGISATDECENTKITEDIHPNWRKPYILITSCSEKWKVSKTAGKIEEIWLDKFEETEALQFVERALGVEGDFYDKKEKRLIEESFPLALRQAVAYVQNEYEESRSKKSSDYLEEYQQQRRRSFEETKELFSRKKKLQR